MASVNKKATSSLSTALTHEGGAGYRSTDLKTLKRLVMTCLLWEDTFYKAGSDIGKQMKDLVKLIPARKVADLAIEARSSYNLRHVPLFLVRELAKVKGNGSLVAETLEKIIQRPDEITEYVSLYWSEKKQPLSAGSKRGLRKAFLKFTPFMLAKYQDQDKQVKLSSVLRMVRPKALSVEQNDAFRSLRHGTFAPIETWETLLSAGGEKKETFETLLKEKKLGGLATLRNLRNMISSGVSDTLIRQRLADPMPRVWPYRFVVAAKYAPTLEDALEQAMYRAAEEIPKLPGVTGLLVDVSGSMDHAMSSGNTNRNAEVTTRIDAACGLAILLREKGEQVKVASFSDQVVQIAPRRGFALTEAIKKSQPHSGTYLKKALRDLKRTDWKDVDRIVVITDEQSHDGIEPSWTKYAYVINLAPYQIGVGQREGWTAINGWSERVFDYILMEETHDV